MVQIKKFLIISPILVVYFVLLLGTVGCSSPRHEAIRGLEGNFTIMTEEVFETEFKLLSFDSVLKLNQVITRVYDEENRLIRKIEKYSYSKDIKKHEYSYPGSEIIIRNLDTNQEYSQSFFALTLPNLNQDILPFRDTVLFGELFVWDPEAYPIEYGVEKYSFENNRYEFVGDWEPYPVTIVYYDDLGYPTEKKIYWSKYYMNSNDGLNTRTTYKYDGTHRITMISEYKDSSQDHQWHLEKERRFTYEEVSL